MEAIEQTTELRQVDLNSAKKSLTEITKNWFLQDEKLQVSSTVSSIKYISLDSFFTITYSHIVYYRMYSDLTKIYFEFSVKTQIIN